MLTLQTLMCFERNADWNGRTIWSCATNLWHPLKRARPVLHYPTQLRGSGHLCKVWKTSNIGDFWPLRDIKKAFLFRRLVADYICSSSYFVASFQNESKYILHKTSCAWGKSSWHQWEESTVRKLGRTTQRNM